MDTEAVAPTHSSRESPSPPPGGRRSPARSRLPQSGEEVRGPPGSPAPELIPRAAPGDLRPPSCSFFKTPSRRTPKPAGANGHQHPMLPVCCQTL